MIRVCHLITGLYTGGAEMMLYKLLAATDRDRCAPEVVSLIDRGALGARIEALGIPVHALGMRRGRPSPAALARMLGTLRAARPDLLQGWMYHGNLAATLAAPLLPGRPPVLWNVRQTLYDPAREKPLTRLMIGCSARLSATARAIVYNSGLAARQHEARGFRAERRVLLPNGFDGARFAPDAEARRRWREREGFGADELLIGLAARDHPMKDHGNFLAAAARLAGRCQRARFVLAGRGVDESNGALRRRIEGLGLAERVRLLGEREDMPDFFRALDLAALASAWGEGFPNVLGEAMASGVPCVATDVGDAAEIVGDTGRIVPPGDPEALAGALAALAALDPQGRARLGALARERILARYALPVIAARYQALYAGTLAQARRR